MTYDFDPELGAAVAVIPPIDFADIPATRAMAAHVSVSSDSDDRTGVSTRDVDVLSALTGVDQEATPVTGWTGAASGARGRVRSTLATT